MYSGEKSMKALGILFLTLFASALTANADGFVCESTQGNVRIKAYHYTAPQSGTRNSAVLIASDPRMAPGNRFIARFSRAKGILNNRAATYEAKVDRRYNDINDGLDTIGNTRLEELKTLKLEVDFSYGRPILDGEYVPGSLHLIRHNGEVELIELDCERYLKN